MERFTAPVLLCLGPSMTPVFKTCVAVKDILGTSQALVAAAPGSLGSFPSTGILSVVAVIWLDGRDGTTNFDTLTTPGSFCQPPHALPLLKSF